MMVPPSEHDEDWVVGKSECIRLREDCTRSRRFLCKLIFAVIAAMVLSATAYAWTTGMVVKLNEKEILRNQKDIAELKAAVRSIEEAVREAVREEFAKQRKADRL